MIGRRALLPLATVTARTDTIAVLDELDKTVVRLELVSPTVGGRKLQPRVRLIGLRGFDAELEEARRALTAAFGLVEAERSLRDEAVTAAGGVAEGISVKVAVELEPDMRADVAAAAVLEALLSVLEANIPGTLTDTDPEFLHDYRVSLRKARAVLKELRDVFEPERLSELRTELKWLQGVTGDARDLDVYVTEFEDLRALVPEPLRDALAPLLAVLRARRLAAHRVMARELRSERAREALAAWRRLLGQVPLDLPGDPADAGRRIEEVASERIRKVFRRIVRGGDEIIASGAEVPPDDYHALRKLGKELRYLLELFGTQLHDPDDGQADGEVPEATAGRARTPSGSRGPAGRDLSARRRGIGPARRRRGADGDGRAD